MSSPGASVRCEVRYTGRVQGVGFRQTTRMLAADFAVVGFVKNLPDGAVELVVEGKDDEVDRFLDAVDRELGHHIVRTQVDRRPAVGEFTDFRVRH